MIKLFVLAIIVALLALTTAASNVDTFESWMQVHQKSYTSEDEFQMRKQIFEANTLKIEKHNKMGLSWTMGINQFADLTTAEFAARYLRPQTQLSQSQSFDPSPTPNLKDLPTSIDWKKKGVVPDVENQGQMGDPTFLAVLTNVESAAAIKSGKIPQLSLAQLEDCNIPNMVPPIVMAALAKRGGLETTADYPPPSTGTCHFNANQVAVKVNGYVNVTTENGLATALANVGPVSVAVDASTWQFYTGGILENCGQQIDHAALAVGYGVLRTTRDYWILQNSWGTSWGMNGMIWLARNGKNTCGLLKSASYPTLG